MLGTQFALKGGIASELDSRIAAAWGKFFQIWPLLRRRNTCLTKRLRLFDMCVSSSALWCCESWCLTALQKRRLRTVERNMLRRFAGPKRRTTDDYICWVRQATQLAEQARDAAGIRSWMHAASFRKWSWAGHLARMHGHRWASRMTFWRDSEWQSQQDTAATYRPLRARAGHFSRWESEVSRFASSKGWAHWGQKAKAVSNEQWLTYGEEFAQFACKSLMRAVR